MLDKIYERSLPEYEPFQTLDDRAVTVARRLTAIVGLLPDASEDKRAKLLSERAALQTEAQSLPFDLAEAARRFVLAHLAYMETRYHELEAKWTECDARRSSLAADMATIQARQKDLYAGWIHNTARLSDMEAAALTEQREAIQEKSTELAAQAKALSIQARPVEIEWYRLKGERDAQVARAGALYGVKDLLNHTQWPRAAHDFGEKWARKASHTLFGNFDSCGGPVSQRCKPLTAARTG